MSTTSTKFNPKDYWESRLSSSFDLKGVGYSSLGCRYNDWLYRIRRKVFLRTARQVNADWSSSRVLDIGSGTGFYLERWGELGAKEISGADLTTVAVDNLRERFSANKIYQLDIGDSTGVPLGGYDVVSIFDVLFHIVDDSRYETAVQHLAQLVVPGGYLFFSDNFVHSRPIRSEHHVSRSKAYIENTLTKAGFEIVLRTPMFVLMNEPVDSKSRLRHLAWSIFCKRRWNQRGRGISRGLFAIPSGIAADAASERECNHRNHGVSQSYPAEKRK